eukprot:6400393-Prymnesium_polylepis.1
MPPAHPKMPSPTPSKYDRRLDALLGGRSDNAGLAASRALVSKWSHSTTLAAFNGWQLWARCVCARARPA